MVILVGLAIDQIAQSGLSSLSVIYYSAQLFRVFSFKKRRTNHAKIFVTCRACGNCLWITGATSIIE
ncbi:hypothetical protein D9D54_18660 [Escherichia coli]|nr:hypothetical protein [Escherichia coli]